MSAVKPYERIKSALKIAGVILGICLILYNIYTGATIQRIIIPGIFEIEFGSPRANTKPDAELVAAEAQLPPVLEPGQFIQNYYTAINNRQFDQTWAMLSDRFKREKNPTGKEAYAGFWDSIARVEVGLVEVRSLTTDSAVLAATITYTKRDGGMTESRHTFGLIFDQGKVGWLMDTQD